MKTGGGHEKGAQFERDVCVKLSLWATAGAKKDCFWRSAMSGGRATVAAKKGGLLRRQAGDISAVAPEGHPLTDAYYIELKHYRDLELTGFLLGNTGLLAGFWTLAQMEAAKHAKFPLLIAKQNNRPAFVLLDHQDKFLTTNLSRVIRCPTDKWLLCDLADLLSRSWPWGQMGKVTPNTRILRG